MTSIRILVKKLKRLTLLIIAIGLFAVLAVSSLIIYENDVLNPAGSNGSWQRPIENFATGLAADNYKVYITDLFGTVSAYTTQSGSLSGTQAPTQAILLQDYTCHLTKFSVAEWMLQLVASIKQRESLSGVSMDK
jgi:hypothetical protein